jgi:holo-[acyl-carrier protein] synthase
MNWGLGIDLLEPERLRRRVTARPDLVHELFTPAEQQYCNDKWDPWQHFAGRYCAKEAVVKALRVDGWDPLEVEIEPGDPDPRVRLYGDMAAHAEALGVEVLISMTHLPAMAAATAMAVPM